MPGPEVGEAYVEIHADTKKMAAELRAAGKTAGRNFGKDFNTASSKELSGIGDRISADMAKAGKRSGARFADEIKRQVKKTDWDFDIDIAKGVATGDWSKALASADTYEKSLERVQARLTKLNEAGVVSKKTGVGVAEQRKSLAAYDEQVRKTQAEITRLGTIGAVRMRRLAQDTDKFKDEFSSLSTSIKAGSREMQDFVRNSGGLRKFGGQKIADEFAEIDRQVAKVNRDFTTATRGMTRNSDGYARALAASRAEITRLGGEAERLAKRKDRITTVFDADTSGFTRGLTSVNKGLAAFRRNTSSSSGSGAGGFLKSWEGAAAALPAEWTLVVKKFGTLAAPLSTLGSGLASSLTAAIGSIGSALTGLVVQFGAIAPAAIYSFALARKSISLMKTEVPEATAAIDRLKAAFNEVDAGEFARQWGPALATFSNALAKSLETDRFAEFNGAAVADITGMFTAVIQSPAWTNFMRAMEQSAPLALRNLGTAASQGISGLLSAFAAAAPQAINLTNYLGELGTRFAASMARIASDGTLPDFLAAANQAFESLMETVISLGGALGNVFAIGAERGQGMLTSLQEMAATFNAWTASVQGNQALTTWFNNGAQIFGSLVPLLGAVGQMFADLVTPETVNQLTALLDDLAGFVPVFGQILGVFANLNLFGLFFTLLNEVGAAISPLIPGIAALAKAIGDTLGAALTAIGPILTQMFAALAPVADQLLTAFGPALAAIVPAITSLAGPLASLGAGLAAGLGSVISALGPLLGQIIPIVSQLAGVLAGTLGAILPVIGDALASLAPVLATVAQALGGALMAVLPVLGQALASLAPLIAMVAQTLGGVLAAVLPVVADLLGALLPIVVQVASTLLTALAPILKMIGPLFAALAPVVLALVQALLPVVTTVIDVVAQLATALMPVIMALLPIISSLAPVIVQVVLAFFPLINIVVQLLPILMPLINVIAQLVTWLLNLLAPVINLIAPFLTFVVTFINVGKAVTKLGGLIADFAETIALRFLYAIDWIKKLFTGFTEFFGGLGRGLVTAAKNVGTFIVNVVKFFVTLPLKVFNALKTLGPKLVEVFAKAWTAARNAVSNGFAAVNTFFGGIPAKIVAALASLGSKLAAVFSAAWTAARTAVSTGFAKVLSFFGGIGGKILDAVGNMNSLLSGIGGDIVAGLKNGISGAWHLVTDGISALVKKIPAPIRKFLGISSPSKLMRQYGQWISEGLALGVEDGADDVVKAVQSVGEDVAKTQQALIKEEAAAIIEARKKANDKIRAYNDKHKIDKNVLPSISSTEATKLATATMKKYTDALSKSYNDTLRKQASRTQTLAQLLKLDDKSSGLKTAVAQNKVTLKDLGALSDKYAAQLVNAQQKLSDLTKQQADYMASVRDSALSVASITNANGKDSVADITETMQAGLDKILAFRKNIATLTKAGLNKTTLADLISAGPDAGADTAAALAAGGSKAVKSVNTLQTKINAAAKGLGTDTSKTFYQAGVDAAKGIVSGIQSQQKTLNTAMTTLAKNLVAAIKKELKIKSPSRVFYDQGQQVVRGLIGGMDSLAGKAAASMTSIAAGVTGAGVGIGDFGGLRRGATPDQMTGAQFGSSSPSRVTTVSPGAIVVNTTSTDPVLTAHAVLDRLVARLA